jgi:hypothetical protein
MMEDWEIGIMSESNPLERLQQSEDALPGLFFVWCVDSTVAYDAILIYVQGRIRFIQVTAGAEQHSFQAYAVIDSLLCTLEGRGIILTHVDFVVVRPCNDDRALFTLERILLGHWINGSTSVASNGSEKGMQETRCAVRGCRGNRSTPLLLSMSCV